MPAKRIGFFDHNLENFHAEVYLKALRGPLAHRGYKVVGATALEAKPGRQWAEARDIPYFESAAALGAAVDFLIVLAPSRPDLHLEMCRQVFPRAVPTFVDKTFAPDEQTAREIFALADEHACPVQTTSALRSTAVQRQVRQLETPLQSLIVFASGPSFEEYGIHPVELAVSCLGPEAEAVMRIGPRSHPQWILRFFGDRTAIIDFNVEAEAPFSAVISTQQSHAEVTVDGSRLFIEAAGSILDFFDAGRPLIDRRESLVVRRILDRAMEPATYGRFVDLSGVESTTHAPAGPHWGSRSRQSTATPDTAESFQS